MSLALATDIQGPVAAGIVQKSSACGYRRNLKLRVLPHP